mmetsp:Transcript_2205/g.4801  ORF Transcript_2205/g.4801 Transcript_2205/m.4801 type:complete len:91 (+) Transcript_2205:288-560(+)
MSTSQPLGVGVASEQTGKALDMEQEISIATSTLLGGFLKGSLTFVGIAVVPMQMKNPYPDQVHLHQCISWTWLAGRASSLLVYPSVTLSM